ncbi:tubulin polyglutamylase TTLL11 [Paragonimus westermani]|uniref:Tubulin polyglutamylase TTLL11 n=1 Tax=Paragonimus westermani TaxID=34504 RepID=A0A5J4NX85_9TREM|nr:tubulin polyglutamylase TTLL11 [Paragonimus westermani]
MQVLDSNNFFDIVWCGTSDIPNVPLENRFVNKFPGAAAVFSKINLFRALELHRRLTPNIYSFYPPTWFLPFQKKALQLDSISTIAYRNENVISVKPTYIVKPDNGTQGRGIYLFQSPQSYIPPDALTLNSEVRTVSYQVVRPSIAVDVDVSDIRSQNLNDLQPALDVVQRYETNPVLLYGCKTDLRVYALIESLSPLKIHVYRDGLVRLASRVYHKPERKNLCKHTMHLTNYAINKLQHPPICETTNWPSAEERSEVKCGSSNSPKWRCKQSLRELLQPSEDRKNLKATHRSFTWGHVDPIKLWSQIDEVICLTVFTLVPQLKVAYWIEYGHTLGRPVTAIRTKMNDIECTLHTTQPPHCFQILGFDFLLVEPDYRPVLLEVNSNPSLRTDAVRHFVHRIPANANSAEHIIPHPNHPPSSKRFGHMVTSSGPVAETAAVLSSVLGDRYAEFERSSLDEHVKGGLIQSTLRLMTARVRENRKNVHCTSSSLPLNNSKQGEPASHSKPDELQLPVLQTPKGPNHRMDSQHCKPYNVIPSSDVLLPNTDSHSSSPSNILPTQLSLSLKLDKPDTEVRTPIGMTKELEQTLDSYQRSTSERSPSGNKNSNALRTIREYVNLPDFAPLECIYTEGDGFNAFINGTAESDLCVNEHRRLHDKLREAQLKVQTKLSNPAERQHSRRNAVPLVLLLNLDAFDSAARVVDLLSDLFLSVLSSRLPHLKLFLVPKSSVQVTDDWTSPPTKMKDSRTGYPAKQLSVPRMDLTSFRAFCR